MLSHVIFWLTAALYGSQPAVSTPIPTPVDPRPYHLQLTQAVPSHAMPCLTGIINHYTPVTGFGCDSSTLEVGTMAGFSAGDKVLLMQMQVPQVDLSNTANFGALLNATCIGNYEFNRVLSLAGNTIQLEYALTRPYDISGKVQLIRVPEYDSATVCQLTCLPWNGTVGGVLALDVATQLTLAGPVDVTGKGFRGGLVENNFVGWVFGEQQYSYPPQSELAGAKGEGIVQIPVDQSFGRGHAGNGGGGGNAHNGGGGGGGNTGAGGDGGLEITNLPALPTPNTNGIGGSAYFAISTNKVLMGGGAGAGHANDTRGSSGGAGGGIVFLSANTLQTNNFRVLANGVDVLGGQEENDGQGGGGGGGSIVLEVGQITGLLNCEVKGGQGGSNPYTPAFQLHGPGGGGGGGKVLSTLPSPNIITALQGGLNGFTSQNLTNGATSGGAGKWLSGFVVPEGTALAHPVSSNMEVAVQSPPCAGLSGQISILQSSALAFSLNNGPWQADSIFPNLPPGQYQVSLQFSGGCTIDTTATIQNVAPVQDTLLSLIDASCALGGSITVTALVGLAPFEFQLNNGLWQPNGTFANLTPGNYTVTLRDAAGCTMTDSYTIEAPAAVAFSQLSIQHATCVAGGAITLAPTAGIGPFEFQLNSGAWQSSGHFQNLLPGNYTVILRDAVGCTQSGNFVINAPPPARDSLLSLVNATCVTGGSISLTVVSGTAPFEFQLNNGSWQQNGQFVNLMPGHYNVLLRDGAGCTQMDTFFISAPPLLQDSLLSIVHASCVQGGSLFLEAVSGTAPFEFQVNGGAWKTNGLFTDLMPGNYAVNVRDAAGCTQMADYSIQAPTVLRDTLVAISHATCISGGSATVAALTGTAPYAFQLNGGVAQSIGTFNNLSTGNYTVTLLDAAGCSQQESFAILAPPTLTDSIHDLTNATCIAGGSVSVTALSGTAPVEFQLNNGLWQSTGAFSNLMPGAYSITLRDAAGCTKSDTCSILAPPALEGALSAISHATCLTGGSITVTVVSGTAPFEFQLQNGPWQPIGVFIDLVPGEYAVTLRDGAGCTQTEHYTINGPPPVESALVNLTNATCLTGGSITITAITGTAPFQFQLENGAWQTDGEFSNLIPGIYAVTLRDAGGCTDTETHTIQAPPPVQVTLLSITQATCLAGGAVAIIATSGTPPFQYQLENGAWQTDGVFSNLMPGAYSVTTRDEAGCTQTATYAILPPPPVQEVLVVTTEVDCDTLGSLLFEAVSGTPPFQFQLNNGSWQSDGYFNQLVSGDYLVTVRDAAGCAHSGSYPIAPYVPLRLQLDSIGVVDCLHATGFVAVSATGGAGDYVFQIDGAEPVTPNGQFVNLDAGTHEVLVRDGDGCFASLNGIVLPDLIDTAMTYQMDTIYEGSYFQLPDGRITSLPGEYPFHYQSIEGCDSLHIIDLIVLKRHVYIPNVFSPDGDGLNDYFTVFSDASLKQVERLLVFDRWGELVFERRQFSPNVEPDGWDGTFRGRALNPGMFVWLVDLTFKDGLSWRLSGDVTVVR